MKSFLLAMESGEETLIGGHCGAKKMGLVFQEVVNRAQPAAPSTISVSRFL
jgi:hypothetical protein